MTRRTYAGGATPQTLVGGLSSVATTATISDNAGWPTSGPFSVVIDRGLGTEEKILVASQATNTLTIQTRGYDGSGAQTHADGATVECCLTATDLDEANQHVNAASGVHNLSSSVVGTADTQTLTNKTLVQPTIGDLTNAQHNHTSAVTGGVIGIHTGTIDVTPGSTFTVISHGAPFSPINAVATISNPVPSANINAECYAISPTQMTVAFRQQGQSLNTTLTSCTINYTVFGTPP